MASTIVADVVVETLTKFGFKWCGDYVNYSKNLPEADRAKVVPGVKFQAELYVADSGKKYLNKVFSTLQKAQAIKKETPKGSTNGPIAEPVTDQPTPATTSGFGSNVKEDKKSDAMTRADWDAKDRRISRQGCIQAAVQAVAPWYTSTEDVYKYAEELANKMLEFVNR